MRNGLTALALVLGMVIGAGVAFVIVSQDNGCYTDAIALAEQSITTTDDLAENVFDSIDRILAGVPVDERAMERIADQHIDNQDRLDELQNTCG